MSSLKWLLVVIGLFSTTTSAEDLPTALVTQFFPSFTATKRMDKARSEMLHVHQYSQNTGWGLLLFDGLASPFLLWHAQWHFERCKVKKWWSYLSVCFIASATAVWQCAFLWQPPAAMQLVAKTIGSRWLCPIVPWNSFKLKRWSIVLVADSLQENETPCILIL